LKEVFDAQNTHFHLNFIALTDKCQRSSECFVSENPDRVECRNEQCQCKYEYSTDVEKQNCVKLGEGKSKFFAK
jgi:hypothetical protein